GAVSLAVAATLATAPTAGAASIGRTYLALGDSLAYGFHEAQFAEQFPHVQPETFDEGYVNDFAGLLGLLHPGIGLINDGCPGETTESMINGSGITGFCAGGPHGSPFPYVWLHHPYGATSQLGDALAILHEDPNVSPITLDIGANDALQFLASQCGFPAADHCTEAQFIAEFGHIAGNTAYILGQLRAAAPHAQIVLLGLYNPYPGVPSEGADKLTAGLNKALAAAAASVPGTSFANPEPLFNPSIIFGGSETLDYRTICAFTAMCPGGTFNPTSPHADIHPTTLGYRVLAADVAFSFFTH
ncbi:MAG: SGNH/GDSL hydrolase family protein, partial [Acidobacteriota bacterium]|nr:SGNH/GDSL hydrolase family protein [Acidobacteriota bacterium]